MIMEKAPITATEMLHIIKETPSVNIALHSADCEKESVIIAFDDERLSHIWVNKGDNRVSYEKFGGDWKLVHYHWFSKRGWCFVGLLKGKKVEKHCVKF